MFTGIVEAVGRVERVGRVSGGTSARVGCPARGFELEVGGSVAVDGVCLTVTARGPGWFEAAISPETARRSTLGGLRPGRRVNLERPLAASGRLGGHFVQGHVDATARVRSVRRAGAFVTMTVAAPAALRPYLVEKGSVALNGVSLTVAAAGRTGFSAALVPHTLSATNLSELRAGDAVNVEVDVLAKYVKALLDHRGGG
jgi:riboflavin synthase